MTPRHKACLDAIAAGIAATGCPPTYEELAAAIGVRSKGTVHRLVLRLQDQGKIRIRPNRARSIEVVGENGLTPSAETGARVVVRLWLAGALTDVEMVALADALGPERGQ